MVKERKIKIAVITEEQSLQNYIALILIGENYDVRVYPTQNEAIAHIEGYRPDLIISEFQSPNINGLKICNILRKSFLFSHTSLIFILPSDDILNKAKLIYAGMDDYIHKPTIEEELVLKVKLSLHRADRQHDINYLTYLPGHASLVKELQKRIDAKIIFAVAHLNLYKLRYYNHRYGFEKGDEMIKYVCSLIINALKEFGSPSDFLSNPYNENFVFLTQLDSIEAIVNKIIDEFNKIYLSFYDENDKKRGYLIIKTRAGGLEKIPLMSIHAGITNNEHYAFINPAQVLQITRELIDFAEKSSPEKSMLVKERRRNYPFY